MADVYKALLNLAKAGANALSKGAPRGGKYFRRVATGNPKNPYRYFYSKESYQKEHGDQAHLHGGDVPAPTKRQLAATLYPGDPALAQPAEQRGSVLDDSKRWNAAGSYKPTPKKVRRADYQPLRDAAKTPAAQRSEMDIANDNTDVAGPSAADIEARRRELESPAYAAALKRARAAGSDKPPLRDAPNAQTRYNEAATKESAKRAQTGKQLPGTPRTDGKTDLPSMAEATRRANAMPAATTYDHSVVHVLPNGSMRSLSGERLTHEHIRSDARFIHKKSLHNEAPMLPLSAQMSKSLYTFTDPQGPGSNTQILKDDYLPDYVDAFLQEAVEHERRESLHNDPNLMPPPTEPGDPLVNAVFGEFMSYVPVSRNLKRALESIPVTKEYVEARMRELGLLHVQSENSEAERNAQVAGYFPQPMALSLHARAQADVLSDTQYMGARVNGQQAAPLPDANDNPLAQLAEHQMRKSHELHAAFGASAPVQTYDSECLYHGRDPMRAGLMQSAVHGVVCTCNR